MKRKECVCSLPCVPAFTDALLKEGFSFSHCPFHVSLLEHFRVSWWFKRILLWKLGNYILSWLTCKTLTFLTSSPLISSGRNCSYVSRFSPPYTFQFKQPLMTWVDESGKGNYLMMFCLFCLIYDVCYELVLIMKYVSFQKLGGGCFWFSLLENSEGIIYLSGLLVILRWGTKGLGPRDTPFPGSSVSRVPRADQDTSHMLHKHVSCFENISF